MIGKDKSWVHVSGTMEVRWTVLLPLEHSRESVACDDPAIEAALQAVGSPFETYLWGVDERPARVETEADEHDVVIDEDDREQVE